MTAAPHALPPHLPHQPRLLQADDAAAYRGLMLWAYRHHAEAFTSSVAEREDLPLSWWVGRLGHGASSDARVLGLVIDGELVGAAGLSVEPRERTRHQGTLFGMVLRPPWRGQGLGDALVAAVLQQARQWPGMQQVTLTVSHGNQPALALYQRHGFQVWGREPRAVMLGDQAIDKLHLWCDLRAVAAAPA